MYLEATPVGLKGDRVHIKSSVWKESSAICKLSFWYYLSDKASGTIRLLIKVGRALIESKKEDKRKLIQSLRFVSHGYHGNTQPVKPIINYVNIHTIFIVNWLRV